MQTCYDPRQISTAPTTAPTSSTKAAPTATAASRTSTDLPVTTSSAVSAGKSNTDEDNAKEAKEEGSSGSRAFPVPALLAVGAMLAL